MCIVCIGRFHAQRCGDLLQQTLLPLLVCTSVIQSGRYIGRPSCLSVIDQIIVCIIDGIILQGCQVFHGEQVAFAVIGERLSKLFLMKEQPIEVCRVVVVSIVQHDPDSGITAGSSKRNCRHVPSAPFLAPQNITVCSGFPGVSVIERDVHAVSVRCAFARYGFCPGPSAGNENIPLIA